MYASFTQICIFSATTENIMPVLDHMNINLYFDRPYFTRLCDNAVGRSRLHGNVTFTNVRTVELYFWDDVVPLIEV